MSSPRGRSLPVVLLGGASAFAFAFVVNCLRRLYADPVHTDFGVLYESGRAWIEGRPVYALLPGGCNLSPPIVLPLFIALAHLPYRAAATALLAASVVAFAAAMRIVSRELRLTPTWGAIVAGALFMGTLQVLREGNIPWLLMLPAALAWRAARRDRWVAAGAWLGLCLAAKPIFGWFVFALAIRRRWRAALAAAGIALLGFFAGVLLFGVSVTRAWLAVGARVTWFGVDTNVSILSVLTRTVARGEFGLLFVGLAAFVLALSALAIAGSREDVDRDWSIVWLVSLLVAPLGWVYYYWLAAGPLIARMKVRSWPVLAAGVALLPHSIRPEHPAVGGSVPFAATVGSSFFWATLLLWLDAVARPAPVNLMSAAPSPAAGTRL